MIIHTHIVNALKRLCCLALAALMLAGGTPAARAEAMDGETGPAAAPTSEPARDFQNSLSRMVGEIGAVTLYHAAYNAETDPVRRIWMPSPTPRPTASGRISPGWAARSSASGNLSMKTRRCTST
jgi:hypothetical protein